MKHYNGRHTWRTRYRLEQKILKIRRIMSLAKFRQHDAKRASVLLYAKAATEAFLNMSSFDYENSALANKVKEMAERYRPIFADDSAIETQTTNSHASDAAEYALLGRIKEMDAYAQRESQADFDKRQEIFKMQYSGSRSGKNIAALTWLKAAGRAFAASQAISAIPVLSGIVAKYAEHERMADFYARTYPFLSKEKTVGEINKMSIMEAEARDAALAKESVETQEELYKKYVLGLPADWDKLIEGDYIKRYPYLSMTKTPEQISRLSSQEADKAESFAMKNHRCGGVMFPKINIE